MTAPFAPQPPREVKAILLGILAVAVVLPFGRREDWIGWVALSITAAVTVGLWFLLIRGLALNTIRWWRGQSRPD